MFKIKILNKLSILGSITLLAAGCNLFGGSVVGAGVAKSVNSGDDWTFSNQAVAAVTNRKKNAAPAVSALSSANVTALRFSPKTTQDIYAATLEQGVFLSENAGASWKQILGDFNAYDIAVDPTNPDHLYVVGQSGTRARVVVSTNKGKSWEELYNDIADQNSARSIVLDPADPKTIVVGFQSGNIITSRDSGASWALVYNFADPITQMVWHANRTLFLLSRTKGLYASTDGGRTVRPVSQQLLDIRTLTQQVVGAVTSGSTSTPPSVDVPANSASTFYRFVVSNTNPQLMYIGADNGLFFTANGGANWRFLKLPLKNSSETIVRGIALADTDKVLYASVGNTIYRTDNAASSWHVSAIATTATINYILVDPGAPSVSYAGFVGGQ